MAGFVSSLIFIAAAHSLGPPSPNPAMTVPLSLTSSSLALLNMSSAANDASLIDATRHNVACYDSRLNKASCEDAWSKIPTDSHVFVFGARNRGRFERPLPYRYISGKSSRFSVVRHDCHSLLIFWIKATVAVLSRSLKGVESTTTPHQMAISRPLQNPSWMYAFLQRIRFDIVFRLVAWSAVWVSAMLLPP